MNPIEPPEYAGTVRFIWRGPQPGIEDLIVRYDRAAQESISVWTFTDEERAAIADGANIALTIIGRHPPVSLALEPAAPTANSQQPAGGPP